MTPRVLHIRPSRFVGGPERQIIRYAQMGAACGVETMICTFEEQGAGSELLAECRRNGTPCFSLPDGSTPALIQLCAMIRYHHISLIAAHGYKADLIGLAAARALRIPIVAFLRGWTGEDFKVRIYEGLDNAFLRFVDRVVCLSAFQAGRISQHSQLSAKTRVVINAIEPDHLSIEQISEQRSRLKREFDIPDDHLTVCAAGRLSREKGTAVFIEAGKQLYQRNQRVTFLIFGDGKERPHLQQSVAGCPAFRFAGHRPDFRQLLPGVDILVNPSFAEEMPNVVLEAMSVGVPVVATAVGSVPEISANGAALALVPAGSPEAIASVTSTLLADTSLRNALGRKGRERVQQHYSPAIQCRQLLTLYNELMPVLASPQKVHATDSRQSSSPTPPALSFADVDYLPFISVVIPVRNEGANIREVLEALTHQHYPPGKMEWIVVDGESTDGTGQIVQEFGAHSEVPVSLIANAARRSSAGRNLGVKKSRGEVVLFIDGHCHIERHDLLRNTAELLRRTGADCLSRPQPLDCPGNTRLQTVIARCRANRIGHGSDSTIYDMDLERFVDPSSSGATYRADVFQRVGLYDETFDACEDVEFNYRLAKAGLKAYSSPTIAIRYRPRSTFRALWQQMIRYGRGRCRLMAKHRDAITLPQLIPAGFLLCLCCLGGLSFHSVNARSTFFVLSGLYAAIVLSASLSLSFKHGLADVYVYPMVFTTIHAGLGVGFITEFLSLLYRRPPPRLSRQTLAGRATTANTP